MTLKRSFQEGSGLSKPLPKIPGRSAASPRRTRSLWHADYLLILPWNIAPEVRTQMADLAAQGTRFVTVVPEVWAG